MADLLDSGRGRGDGSPARREEPCGPPYPGPLVPTLFPTPEAAFRFAYDWSRGNSITTRLRSAPLPDGLVRWSGEMELRVAHRFVITRATSARPPWQEWWLVEQAP